MKGKKILVGTALTAAALSGGTAAASDYPPAAPPPSTVVSSGQTAETPEGPVGLTSTASSLANTGNNDTALILEIGGAALLAGAGLVFVTKRRRRVAPT